MNIYCTEGDGQTFKIQNCPRTINLSRTKVMLSFTEQRLFPGKQIERVFRVQNVEYADNLECICILEVNRLKVYPFHISHFLSDSAKILTFEIMN